MSTMLPAPPKSLGRLGEVLKSSLDAVLGQPNSLDLKPRRTICTLMIDGLGFANLQSAGAHASYLNSSNVQKISCFFPATTSTSLTSFAVGIPPWQSNFTGYQIFDRQLGKAMNLLSGWESFTEGANFQSQQTVSEIATASGVGFHVVSPAAYEHSGLTGATMRSARYHGLNLVESRFERAKDLLRSETGLIYLYVPELDQTAHAYGVSSSKWLSQLESLDSLIQYLSSTLPKDAGLIVTADHGVIDVTQEEHLYLDEVIPASALHFVGGDTRGLQLYLKDSEDLFSMKSKLIEHFGEYCYVVEPSELVAAGWWQETINARYMPDLLLLARKNVALYHRDFAKKKSLQMVGHHGAVTDVEISIPLIRYNL